MQLNYRTLGTGKPLIILHGLYGCSDNWLTISKTFASNFQVILPDLRNHGQSPHSDVFNIPAMAQDLNELINTLNLSTVCIIGHSLGGKVAMEYVAKEQQKVEKIIVVDIAPRKYSKTEFEQHQNHLQLINILKNIDLSLYQTRSQALNDLLQLQNGERIKNLMMKNLATDNNGNLHWKINIKAIADNLADLLNNYQADLSKVQTPILFMRGQNSDYLTLEDFETIKKTIPNANVLEVPNASHWLQVDNPNFFIENAKKFLFSK